MTADARTIDEMFQAVLLGEPNAFERLHRATEPRVRATILRTLVDPWQSEEVTQEVFIEIWQKATAFDAGRGGAISWMLTIAKRRAVDRVRAAQASRERDHRYEARNHHPAHDEVWEKIESGFDRELLFSGLDRITPLQRQALTTTYLNGRTIAQAAEQLGASEKAVSARVRDGIHQLRLTIARDGDAA